MQLLVKAGPHPRFACPVRVACDPPDGAPTAPVTLTDLHTCRVIPAQLEIRAGRPFLHWIIDHLRAGEERRYTVQFGGEPPDGGGVQVAPVSDSRVDLTIGGRLFTAYHCGADLARPYCYPLNDTLGSCVTRANVGEKEGETTDHVHHRSLWTAYGEVNDTDNWSEGEGHGYTRHRAFECLESGRVYGRLCAAGDWVTADGQVLLHETRDLRVYDLSACSPSVRLMDVTIDLEGATPVHFGDTKEGGFLSVRVATSMDAARDGRIENSYGAIGESECWGRRAFWCDYSGPVDSHWAGIAVLEHPDTFRSPTYWHVRDYGLMSTNPFGEGTFRNDPGRSGAYTLPEGERLRFAYRVVVHAGDASEARIADIYHQYVNPPSVHVVR